MESAVKSHLYALIDSIQSEDVLLKITTIVESALHPDLSEWIRVSESFDRDPTTFIPYQKAIADLRTELNEKKKSIPID